MPGPYRPGPITPDIPAAEPKYNGPSGPSEPDFGDPGLTKKKNYRAPKCKRERQKRTNAIGECINLQRATKYEKVMP